MNERLKELAMQANIEFTYDPTETPVRAFAECWEDELEKFAELIIRECVTKTMEVGEQNDEPIEPIWVANCIAHRIFKHFGVGE